MTLKPLTEIAKLERKLIAAVMRRWPLWIKENGSLKRWGDPLCVKPKSAWNVVAIAKALYEAKHRKT